MKNSNKEFNYFPDIFSGPQITLCYNPGNVLSEDNEFPERDKFLKKNNLSGCVFLKDPKNIPATDLTGLSVGSKLLIPGKGKGHFAMERFYDGANERLKRLKLWSD